MSSYPSLGQLVKDWHDSQPKQQTLWIDSYHPPAAMSEQIISLGEQWLPQARAALRGSHG